MSSKTIFLLAALIGGAVVPAQVAINSRLTTFVGQPMQVTFISFIVGSIRILFDLLTSWLSLSRFDSFSSIFVVDVDWRLFGIFICLVNYFCYS